MPIYDNVRYDAGCDAPIIIEVNLQNLSQALRKNHSWAHFPADRIGGRFKQHRYDEAIYNIRHMQQITLPYLSMQMLGEITIVDGRDCLYALIDEGYTEAHIVLTGINAERIEAIINAA